MWGLRRISGRIYLVSGVVWSFDGAHAVRKFSPLSWGARGEARGILADEPAAALQARRHLGRLLGRRFPSISLNYWPKQPRAEQPVDPALKTPIDISSKTTSSLVASCTSDTCARHSNTAKKFEVRKGQGIDETR